MKPLLKITQNDVELIHNIITERNLKEGAIRRFRTPILKYLKYHQEVNNKNTTMTKLLNEAHDEQEQGINPQKTQLCSYLTEFRVYLNNKVGPRTLQNYMVIIKEIYRHNNIIIPQLRPFKLREPPQTTYEDIPSHEEIRRACTISTIDMRTLILFQSSSGTTLHESSTITIDMFFKACAEYIEYVPDCNIQQQLNKLKQEHFIIPCFHLERVKTNKYYYTCCSDEATRAIIQYLQFRIDSGELLDYNSKLFPYPKSTYTKKYSLLNDKLGLGFIGRYGKFRSHALRKFHASNLGCSVETIDELQGRGKSVIHEAYIKDRPQKIKQEYIEHMGNILIFDVLKNDDTNDVIEEDVQNVQHKLSNKEGDICHLYKEIGKLEARIEMLEKEWKNLNIR